MEGVIPLTDSRLRPDIQAMEIGDIGMVCKASLWSLCCTTTTTAPSAGVQVSWCHDSGVCDDWWSHFADLASAEKKRLEEKQRTARKNRTKSTDEWKTRWVLVSHDVMMRFGPLLIYFIGCFILSKRPPVVFSCLLCCHPFYSWPGTLPSARGLVQSFAKIFISLVWSVAQHRPPLGKMYNCIMSISDASDVCVTLLSPNDSIFVSAVCFYFYFFRQLYYGSPVNFSIPLIIIIIISTDGSSKALTLTTKLRTGSTWKATGTESTLCCLTYTNY